MTEISAMQSRKKKPTAVKGFSFLILLILIGAALILLALTRRSVDGPLIPDQALPALSVQVASVNMQNALTLEEAFSGLILARQSSQIGFTSGGRIISVKADMGDRVEARQILAVLDTRQLRASKLAAEARQREAEASHALALTTLQRQLALKERGHVAQQRVDEAKAQADAAMARIEAAKAQIEALHVQIDLSSLRAPYAGVITRRFYDEGSIAAPGSPVLEIVENRYLEANIGVPARTAHALEVGQIYELKTETGQVPAKLKAKTGIIDPNGRTVSTLFEIDDPDSVDIGAVARLKLPRQVEESGFWVPISALTEASRGLWSIYILEPDGNSYEARPRYVEMVHSEGDRVYVRGTVRDGERYIVSGLARFVPGQSVTPIEAQAVRLPSKGQ